ncbi:hypothetical protein D9753_34050 [Streptomyces dangxiongensis]|uniref:Uncharacterized protein n=1 Tax=Streptomyces dangxiongensis TaxID=1442032 RepID=A0A3G2JNS2_9ACTN|nr:hypothetical protein [Streptomyces dangxiongensis]AYN43075.1 hypothetical protein D9753_34050 [Streptomyces dangxiongensis]
MNRVRLLLARHLWLQLTLSLLVAVALIVVLFPGRPVLSVLLRTAFTSVGAIAVVLTRRRKERRAAGGSADAVVALDAKLRRGEVPSAPEERGAMRELVAQRLHRMRHRVPALICLAVLFTAVTLLMVFTGTVRQAVGFAVLTVVFVGWIIYHGNRRHERLRTMDAALKAGEPARAPR